MSVRSMRAAMLVFAITALAALIGAGWAYHYITEYPDQPMGSGGKPVKLVIPRGANFRQVLRRLDQAGLKTNQTALKLFAHYKGLAGKVRAGTYTLDSSTTPRKLLDTLVLGVPAPLVSVLIPEGKNMVEVAEILHKAKIANRDKMLEAMRNVHLLRRLGVPGRTMEGFLFPDTYRLKAGTSPQEIMRVLYKRHKRVYYRIRKKYPKQLRWLRKRLGWGHFEIVTLASIVEKETGQSFERPRIANVFLNRLVFPRFRSRLLQTDPTIVYGCVVPEEKSAACRKFKDRIRRIHLNDKDNPYNTYAHSGLPPGPIANPGKAAMEAVMAPEKGRYLYFVSKNDGTHYFSKSVREHERAVDKYQRGK
jgi:UPF0755 protein